MVKGITPQGLRFALVHSSSKEATAAYKNLTKRYGQYAPTSADIIVALGGDGFLLETLGRYGPEGKGVFGMNRGMIGLLLNNFNINHLPERLEKAKAITLYRLHATAQTKRGETIKAKAINEVSLFRQTIQTAQLRISVNGIQRLQNLIYDGIVISTPAVSTAYNFSANGRILPLEANLIALTPIAAFRPRRWGGALMRRNVTIEIDAMGIKQRPVAAAANGLEIRDISKAIIETDQRLPLRLLFDHDTVLQERVLCEQFSD